MYFHVDFLLLCFFLRRNVQVSLHICQNRWMNVIWNSHAYACVIYTRVYTATCATQRTLRFARTGSAQIDGNLVWLSAPPAKKKKTNRKTWNGKWIIMITICLPHCSSIHRITLNCHYHSRDNCEFSGQHRQATNICSKEYGGDKVLWHARICSAKFHFIPNLSFKFCFHIDYSSIFFCSLLLLLLWILFALSNEKSRPTIKSKASNAFFFSLLLPCSKLLLRNAKWITLPRPIARIKVKLFPISEWSHKKRLQFH